MLRIDFEAVQQPLILIQSTLQAKQLVDAMHDLRHFCIRKVRTKSFADECLNFVCRKIGTTDLSTDVDTGMVTVGTIPRYHPDRSALAQERAGPSKTRALGTPHNRPPEAAQWGAGKELSLRRGVGEQW